MFISQRKIRCIGHIPEWLSLLDKDIHINPLLILKLLYTICKCNHTEWPHVGLYGSEKAFRKIGLFPLISLSTASLKTKNWELTLPWMSQRWLRYLAIEMVRGSRYWKKNLFWELLLYLISQGVSFHVFNLLREWSLLPQQLRGEAFQITNNPNPASLYCAAAMQSCVGFIMQILA